MYGLYRVTVKRINKTGCYYMVIIGLYNTLYCVRTCIFVERNSLQISKTTYKIISIQLFTRFFLSEFLLYMRTCYVGKV